MTSITPNLHFASQGDVYSLRSALWVPQPLDAVFSFFKCARNLEKLTPPFVSFKILTPGEIAMHVGSVIDYSIKLRGIPIPWRTEITAWNPPHSFQDTQTRGPYKLWRHTHSFSAVADGTLITDTVEYQVYGGTIVHTLFVKKDLARIFSYRHEAILKIFAVH